MTALERLRLRVPDSKYSDAMLEDYLESAKAAILAKRYPFGEPPEDLPKRYAELQLRLAVVLINRIGIEGETQHSEATATRQMDSIDNLLSEVVPMGKVVKRA